MIFFVSWMTLVFGLETPKQRVPTARNLLFLKTIKLEFNLNVLLDKKKFFRVKFNHFLFGQRLSLSLVLFLVLLLCLLVDFLPRIILILLRFGLKFGLYCCNFFYILGFLRRSFILLRFWRHFQVISWLFKRLFFIYLR